MKVLVTGASGFIGSWLTRKLLDLGHEVRVLARSDAAAAKWNETSVQVFRGDISDVESLKNATRGTDIVYHLAGLVGYSRAMYDAMVATNVVGTANVIEACTANKVRRLLHMSSVTAIGASFDGQPLNENSEYNLRHLHLGYFETKREAEELVMQAARMGALDAVCVNPSTVYGAGDAQKGSRKTQLKVAQGKMPFYTAGGVNVIHIEDVVNAIVTASQIGRTGERYILAGENITIKELFRSIAEAAGVTPPKIYLPTSVVHSLGWMGDRLERFGKKGPLNSETAWTSTLFHWFDNSKAKAELGLKPKPYKVAIAESVNWMRENNLI